MFQDELTRLRAAEQARTALTKILKKVAELEETVRYENMRNKAYNEQFLKDKDIKEQANKLLDEALMVIDDYAPGFNVLIKEIEEFLK
jgi:hypothetical protein